MINPILTQTEQITSTATTLVLGFGPGQTVPPRYLFCNPTGNMTITLPLSTATEPNNTGVPNYLPGAGPGYSITFFNISAFTVTLAAATGDTLVNVPAVISGLYSKATVCSVPATNNWYGLDSSSGSVSGFQTVTTALTLAQLQAAVTGVSIIPAQGTGTLIEVQRATLDLAYGSANFAGAGIGQLSYGNATTYPASATFANAFYTTFAANQAISVAGALASTASTNILNTAVWYNANANFTSGTGASGVLSVGYRVISGLS